MGSILPPRIRRTQHRAQRKRYPTCIGDLLLLSVLLFMVILGGCASSKISIKSAQNAQNYHELLDILGDFECKQADNLLECLYNEQSVNIFLLERRERQFRFMIDGNGQILGRNLHEVLTKYNIFPRFQLPNTFDEFK